MDIQHKQKTGGASRGGMDVLNKGGMDVLNKGGMDLLSKLRRQRIEETELYYGDLELAQKTGWHDFIRQGWSRWLAEDTEAKSKSSPETDWSNLLDERYSAQQCALNLLWLCRELEGSRKPASPQPNKESNQLPIGFRTAAGNT